MSQWAGLDEAFRAIDGLGELASREVSVRALKAAAKPLAADMRQGIARRTGLTAEDITVAESKESTDEVVVLVGGTRGKRGRSYIMRFLEWGTARMRAQPFMRPAWDRGRTRFFSDMLEHYRAAYKGIVAKYARTAA